MPHEQPVPISLPGSAGAVSASIFTAFKSLAYFASEGMEQTHQENTSIIKYNDENALACVVTLAFYTARNQYEIIRELPTGKGYADIAFLPRPNENVPAIVVELKKEQDASIALEQIRSRQYTEKLSAYSGEIILVGINYTTDPNTEYKKHTCRIEKIVK